MDLKRDYYEDVQLRKDRTHKFWFVALIAALIVTPFITPSYNLYLINLIAIHIIVTVGLNVLIGYTGQISLGHAGFFAIGAYTTVLSMIHFSLPFPLAILLAAIVAAGFGFLLGLPALRLEGPYLAIATLGFGMAVTQIIGRVSIFGGHMGLQVPDMDFGLFSLKPDIDNTEIYFVIIAFTVLLTLAARNITRTRVGRAFIAIRDSDIAASALGVNLSFYKTLSFAFSACYAGIAGGLYAFILGFINPNIFDLVLSILFLTMVVVGGPGSILGSIMGGAVVTFLNVKLESVQNIPIIGDLLKTISAEWMSLSGLPNITFVLFGLILIFIVVFERMGLYGLWLRTKIYWRTWPF